MQFSCKLLTIVTQFSKDSSIKRFAMDLGDVVKKLDNFAPLGLACDWDNVGLLVEPSGPHKVNTIMLTNDLTEEVFEEALGRKAQLIVAYHPFLFHGLKRITQKDWKQRLVARCFENRIAVYSPHTIYDALAGGINDWLAAAFGGAEIHPIIPSKEGDLKAVYSHKFDINLVKDPEIQKDLHSFIEECKLDYQVWNGAESLSIFAEPSKVNELSCCLLSRIPKLLPHIAVTKLEQLPLMDYGMGRKCVLQSAISLNQAVDIIKRYLKLEHVRLAVGKGRSVDEPTVKTVGIGAGAGWEVLKVCKPVDIWWSGEMSHHQVVDAVQNGTSVILCEHSNTERGYLATLPAVWANVLPQDVQVLVSSSDKDPLKVV